MKAFIAMLSLVILLSAYPAWAEGPRGGLGFRGHGPEGGGVLGRLIAPCHFACFDEARLCRDTAEAGALNDIPQSCSTEIGAAQSACTPNHATPDACQTARSDLRNCAQSSLMTLRTNVQACHTTAETCIATCNSKNTP